MPIFKLQLGKFRCRNAPMKSHHRQNNEHTHHSQRFPCGPLYPSLLPHPTRPTFIRPSGSHSHAFSHHTLIYIFLELYVNGIIACVPFPFSVNHFERNLCCHVYQEFTFFLLSRFPPYGFTMWYSSLFDGYLSCF